MRVSVDMAWLLISYSAVVIYISGLLICLIENRGAYEVFLVMLGLGLGFAMSSIIVNFTRSCKKWQEMSEQEIAEWDGVEYMKIPDKVDMLEIKDNGDEAKANAHLIAAAPEMYDMLEHIEDVLDDSSGCGEISVEKIRKLLKKARGEE